MRGKGIVPVCAGVVVMLSAAPAFAAGDPGARFFEGVLHWLTVVIGPFVFGIGFACLCHSHLMSQNPQGKTQAFHLMIAGAGLFSVETITEFVQRLAR